MSQIVQTLADPALKEAMEANFSEEMACMARSLPGGELDEEAEIQRFFTGRSGFNGVLRTRITSNNSADIHAKIAETLDYFRGRHVSIGWPVTSLTQPANLAIYLEAHDLTLRSTDTDMALDIATMHDDMPIPSGLVIKEITDHIMLKIWRTITIQGFESMEEMGQFYYDTYTRLGFGRGTQWHHYLGWLNHTPVAIASLLLHAGVAGIYGIATMPEARRQGVGTAMTLHTLQAAQALGYRVAILAPSKMGFNLYHRIGFQEYMTTQFYYWSPDR